MDEMGDTKSSAATFLRTKPVCTMREKVAAPVGSRGKGSIATSAEIAHAQSCAPATAAPPQQPATPTPPHPQLQQARSERIPLLPAGKSQTQRHLPQARRQARAPQPLSGAASRSALTGILAPPSCAEMKGRRCCDVKIWFWGAGENLSVLFYVSNGVESGKLFDMTEEKS